MKAASPLSYPTLLKTILTSCYSEQSEESVYLYRTLMIFNVTIIDSYYLIVLPE